MARLVDDLLSLSRIELNEHVRADRRGAARAGHRGGRARLELRAAERGIRFVRSFPPELPEVQGDRDELAQVFQNLLDNAVNYARPNSEIMVTARRPGAAAGAGAGRGRRPGRRYPRRAPAAADRALLSGRSARRSRELGGTGLGLAIVKHIVSRHRGRLEIASTARPGLDLYGMAARGRVREPCHQTAT